MNQVEINEINKQKRKKIIKIILYILLVLIGLFLIILLYQKIRIDISLKSALSNESAKSHFTSFKRCNEKVCKFWLDDCWYYANVKGCYDYVYKIEFDQNDVLELVSTYKLNSGLSNSDFKDIIKNFNKIRENSNNHLGLGNIYLKQNGYNYEIEVQKSLSNNLNIAIIEDMLSYYNQIFADDEINTLDFHFQDSFVVSIQSERIVVDYDKEHSKRPNTSSIYSKDADEVLEELLSYVDRQLY